MPSLPRLNRRVRPARAQVPSVRRAIGRFAAGALLATVVIGAGAWVVASRTADSEALHEAEQATRIEASAVIAPVLTDAVLTGDARALAALDSAVRAHVLSADVVRVKLWTAAGRVVYADDPRLINTVFPLGADETAALNTGAVDSDISDLSNAENALERGQEKLVEVYLPVRTPGGTPLLFETYQRYGSVAEVQHRIFTSFLPAILGGLVVLAAVQVPLAWRLARRLETARREREGLLQRAIDASAIERRRIAHDLHDGVVQDLAGTALVLSTVAGRLRSGGPPAAEADTLDSVAATARRVQSDVRSLILELAPPGLDRVGGLQQALEGLVAPLATHDVRTSVTVAPDLPVDAASSATLFRVAQEAVRNAGRHSGATAVDVAVTAAEGALRIEIADNGRGVDAAERARREADGHAGLRLLEAMVHDTGGTFTVDSTPGAGTRVVAEVGA